jgi:hypothetical protein
MGKTADSDEITLGFRFCAIFDLVVLKRYNMAIGLGNIKLLLFVQNHERVHTFL